MLLLSIIVALLGLIVCLCGALWLWFGLNPESDRYTDDGMLYPGQQRSEVLPRYIRDSRRPTLMVVIGGGIQVVAGILSLVATLPTS
ncbi:hypothetical protein ACLBWV_11760 [Microbacterium paraoxydans]